MKKKVIESTLVLTVIISCIYLVVMPIKQTILGQQTTTAKNFLPFENSTYGIKAQYPSNWDKQENGTRQDTETDLVTFYPPSTNSNASLDISIDDISDEKGTTLAQYAHNGITDLNQSLKNFKLDGSGTNSVLAGLPTYNSTYTYVEENVILKDMEIGAIKGNNVYIATYEAGINEYNKYLPVIQKVLDSLQITK